MWDIVMAGLGLGLFFACLGYIRVCGALRDLQPEANPVATAREGQS